jgi:hypothetical protein
MAGLIAKNRLLAAHARAMGQLSVRAYGGTHSDSTLPLPLQKVNIGTREVVGYGANGELTYIDNVMAPFPAIRWAHRLVCTWLYLSFQVQGGQG